MLKRLWRWLKQSFQRLFGSKQTSAASAVQEKRVESLIQITDAEYESLFLQLLEEVNNGLTGEGVKGFLAAKRINEAYLVAWLRGFGERLLASATPNDELARRMVQLGDLSIGEVSDVAYDIGRRLWERGETNREGAKYAKEGGEREEAINQLNAASESTTNWAETWFNLGNEQLMVGAFAAAIASFDNALKFKPDDHQAWFNRGAALGYLGQWKEAIASFDNALKFKPNFHETWFYRGLALDNLGQWEEAIASFDNALKFKPDYHEAWCDRGVALRNLGQSEQAIASYDNALKFKPDYHEAWNNRGVALRNLGQPEEAITSYDNALKFKPDYHDAWNNRGTALVNLGKPEQAIASYNNALKFKPDYHEAWYNQGTALVNLGQPEQAIASYDNALKFKPDYHEAWHNRGVAAGNSVRCNQLLASLSSIARQNPQLNQRGYEGELASYEEGLKYCHQDTHAEGWGLLHQAIGNAHYFRGRGDSHARYYWRKAVTSYNEALKTLTEVDFPELHLEVLQDLIRVQFDLGETDKAAELQRRGTDFLRRLLAEPNRHDRSKKQLALQFAGFQQLTVDLLVQSGQLVQAVELAEEGKNSCLRWLLDGWSDEISSPSYSEIQQLLNSSTAIVYWHLSSYALHTFILKQNAEPIVLGETQVIEETGLLIQAQRLRDFEGWLKNWNEQYADYGKGKDKQGEQARAWRDNLPEMLDNLSNILDIKAIVSAIPKITQLILIPHRDLHRFPLHALFPPEFTITYLPSAQIGLIPNSDSSSHFGAIQSSPHPVFADANTPLSLVRRGAEGEVEKSTSSKRQLLLSIEHPESTGYPSLEFAQVESEAISRMFSNPTRKRSGETTKEALITTLPQNYNIFHFTGHGVYNFQNPALSYLALAGEEKLTVADIRNFDLRSYQLVSLAACETAITGNHTITTEYVGLVSGFMSCGVAHVVSTLWTVESEASALVMIQFYQLLQQGKSEAVALAEATQWLRNVTNAQLAQWYTSQINKLPETETIVRRFLSRHLNNLKNQPESSNQPYNRPYFWAAFTITGIFPSCNQ